MTQQPRLIAMGGGGFSMGDRVLDDYVLGFVDASRPKVCLLPTATSNVGATVAQFLAAFPSHSFEPTFLDLFERRVEDIRSFLGEQDLIYVGGGSTANMLSIWRVHELDGALRTAWDAGVTCCGVSAGANCWFEASATESFFVGRTDPLVNGLGMIPGSFCPHYDSVPERRTRYRALVAAGILPAGIACDDFVAVRFEGTSLVEAVASRASAGAYHVTACPAGVREEQLSAQILSSHQER